MATNNTNMEKSYEANITFEFQPLSKIDKVGLLTGSAQKLEELVPEPGAGGSFILEGITNYAKVHIHNEKARDNKDYDRLVIFTDDGHSYYTGSQTFCDRFEDIVSLMFGEDNWGIECFKGESTNYKGKSFLSCRVVRL